MNPEEDLFVTFVGAPGHFFGQFQKLPMNDLKAIEMELHSVYDSVTLQPGANCPIPLLYSGVRGHVGDFGVVKWAEDESWYRVRIVEEFCDEVMECSSCSSNCLKQHKCFLF